MMLIIRKIKEKGLLWLIARVRQELRFPSNKSVKAVIDFLLVKKDKVFLLKLSKMTYFMVFMILRSTI